MTKSVNILTAWYLSDPVYPDSKSYLMVYHEATPSTSSHYVNKGQVIDVTAPKTQPSSDKQKVLVIKTIQGQFRVLLASIDDERNIIHGWSTGRVNEFRGQCYTCVNIFTDYDWKL